MTSTPKPLERRHVPRDLRPVVTLAVEQGWQVVRTRGGHIAFLSPDGKTRVVCPSTSGDHRSVLNTRADLRRAGLAL